jgi:hypothetical protein
MSNYLTLDSFRRAIVTLVLIFINFFCFIVVNVIKGGSGLELMWLDYLDVVIEGEWWRFGNIF